MMKKMVFAFLCGVLILACDDNSSSSKDEELQEVPIEDSSSSDNVVDSSGSESCASDSCNVTTGSNASQDSLQSSSSISVSNSSFSYTEEMTAGFVYIDSPNKTVELENKMKVNLRYDFYIGKSEVTCGDFYATTPRPPKKVNVCENDSLPVGNVSFFDIVLYLNAKSKANQMDTAYTYSGILFDTEGHVLNLEGFAFHEDANGYRLPTEAEWTYVASQKWDPKNSWNNSNSGFVPHKVCTFSPENPNFCDLAGNVMEWANDWYAPLFDTTVTNFTGAPDGGTIGKRVVKGGSFNVNAENINILNRNDIYTITSSTHVNYIGFRLALGKIPNATWLSANKSVVASRTIPLASATIVKSIVKTYNAKLIFRNDVSHRLNYIKYNEDIPAVIEMNDTVDAYHPDISPDGNYVAFCSAIEGITGPSKLYVRSLMDTSLQHVELNVESAAIPRWKVLENGDTVITYVTDAGNNKDDAFFASTSTWQVKFENGQFGTPVKLFDGAYHGGISNDGSLAVTGARLLRARRNGQDDIWYNGEQACNASLAMDGTKRTAFLDFGGKTGKEFIGNSYAAHEYILIVDSLGKLVQSIKAPSGYTFDHVEWATDGFNSNLIATLTNSSGFHTKIVLVEPSTGKITNLAESDDLWHPCLWIQKNSTIHTSTELNTDSAGIYYISGYPENTIQWRYKMELFWQYKDVANTVFLGSSRSHYGFIPNNITAPDFAINMACPFNVNYGVYYLVKNYIVNHMKNLKYVVIGIDMDRFVVPDDNNFFRGLAMNIPGYKYDLNHEFWAGKTLNGMYEITHGALGLETYATQLLPNRGFDDGAGNNWPTGTPLIVRDTIWTESDSLTYYSSFNYLVEILKLAQAHHFRVIGVELPYNPTYRNTGAYSKEGIRRSRAPALLQEIADLSLTYPNFTFFDLNQMGNHDFEGAIARDSDHLGRPGAQLVTTKVDSLLKTLPDAL